MKRKLLGKRGVTINEIKNTSKCSIEIDRETTGSNEMKITMKGTNEQITRAKVSITYLVFVYYLYTFTIYETNFLK